MKHIGILLLFVVLCLGVVSTMQALPQGGVGHDDVYYSDATYSDIVGERYMECYGSPYNWGVRTPYVDRSTWGCQSQPQPYCQRYLCTDGPYTDADGQTYYLGCTFNGVC
jgi:hypothetical protein